MGEREQRCIICDRDMMFEVPPCTDGHAEDCPELVCTRCGAAEVLFPLNLRLGYRPHSRRVAPMQRRAA